MTSIFLGTSQKIITRKYQRGSFMAAVLAMQSAGGGSNSSDLHTHSFTIDSYSTARGIDLGVDYWPKSNNTFGSLANRDLHGLTIDSFYYFNDYNQLTFGLSTTGEPDTDETFYSLNMNGHTYLRSDRINYYSSLNGGTVWLWSPGAGFPWAAETTYTFTVVWL